jgi:hypothetical protein
VGEPRPRRRRQGRRDEARRIVDEAIERNPGPEAKRLGVEVLRTMNDDEGARALLSGTLQR